MKTNFTKKKEMFSGLVREIAVVKSFANNILTLQAKHQPKIGDSIAINGVCLSVIQILDDGFCVELSTHTQKHIAIENYKDSVHIEPAITLQDRLDGHIVQGHIDGIGNIISIKKYHNQVEFILQVPKEILLFCVPKGSICIDGISLTLAEVYKDSFKLVIIPHTFENTLFHTYKINTRVNVETDVLVRSIYHLMQNKNNLGNLWDVFDSQTLGF